MKIAVLFPAARIDEQAKRSIDSLKKQKHEAWECYVFPSADSKELSAAVTKLKEPRVKVAPAAASTLAQMMNWAAKETGADLLLPLPPGIVLRDDAFAKFVQIFQDNPDAAVAFSSYTETDASGKTTPVKLYPHEGAPHERFDFGYLKMYRADRLKDIGGFRTDLKHSAEYDVDLKLADKYTHELIDEPLYTVHLPEKPDESATPAGLHSPGKGKLGGFSYVFYPPDLEAEVTGVFEEALKRRGAWIEHDTVPVNYHREPYPVLASVVIPVLNRARYIGNAIERVLEGSYQDFEVVIVDNGSTDGTQDVVRSYAEKDPRVRLIQRDGGTIASALNAGIRAARGKYICQLDSDDEYTPDTLEKMVGHMESHPKCGLAISYYELMDENRGKIEGIEPVTHKGYTRNQILRRDGAGALRVFPKVVLEEMGYYDEEHFGNFGEDYDMVLKVGEKYDVDRVHHVLYRYRRHEDNTDVTRDPLMKIQNKNNARLNALRRRTEFNKRLSKSQAVK